MRQGKKEVQGPDAVVGLQLEGLVDLVGTLFVITEPDHVVGEDGSAEPGQGGTKPLLLFLEAAVGMLEMTMRGEDAGHRGQAVHGTVEVTGQVITGKGLDGDVLHGIPLFLVKPRADNGERLMWHMFQLRTLEDTLADEGGAPFPGGAVMVLEEQVVQEPGPLLLGKISALTELGLGGIGLRKADRRPEDQEEKNRQEVVMDRVPRHIGLIGPVKIGFSFYPQQQDCDKMIKTGNDHIMVCCECDAVGRDNKFIFRFEIFRAINEST